LPTTPSRPTPATPPALLSAGTSSTKRLRLSTSNDSAHLFTGAELEGADAGVTEPHREADTSDAASSGSEDGEYDYGVCDSCGLRAAAQWTQPECLDCYNEH
jgi:hypothetical protein